MTPEDRDPGREPPELVQPPAPPPRDRVIGDRGIGDRGIGDRGVGDRGDPLPTQPSARIPASDDPDDTVDASAERDAAAAHPVFAIESWLDAPAGTFPSLADGEPGDDLDRAFAADRFHEYDSEVLPGSERPLPAASVSPYGMPPDDAPAGRPTRVSPASILLGVCVAVIALVALAAAFAGGRAAALVGRPMPAPSASPSPRAAPTGIPVSLAAPGVVPWDRLGGGECFTGFTTPWADTFTVVDCRQQHTAQLVLRARFSDSATSAFPGSTALQQRMAALCTAQGVVDLSKAVSADDLQLSTAYPATRTQWESGDRDYFCFVSRQSGAPISGSIAGAAQQAVWAARAEVPRPSATSNPGG